jgi:gliding motility-associated-like protein
MSYIKHLKTPIFFLLLGIYSLYFSSLKACETFSSIEQKICEGESFNFNGIEISTAGIYTDTLTNAEDCDSIITLNLIVNQKFNKNINATICQGKSYKVGYISYTTTGNYKDTLISMDGCDSIVNLALTVNPTVKTTLEPKICQGDSIIVETHIYKTSGSYFDTLSSNTNCDSIIHTILTVIATTTKNISVTICDGESFSIGIHTYNTTGNFRDTLKNSFGCDSIISLNLTVRPPILNNLSRSICNGKTYIFGSDTLSTSGTYQKTFTSQNGCDSLVVLQLKVNPKYLIQQTIRICQGEKLVIGTKEYTTSGIYTDQLLSSLGCDSTIITNLTVTPTIRDTIYPIICQGSSFQVGNKSYTSTGIYKDTLKSSINCDSIVVTNLSVTSSFKVTVNKTFCEGEIYNFNGQILTQNGTYKDTLMSQIGCDSIITLNLIFLPKSIKNISATICNKATYQVDNKIYNTTGNYSDTLKSINNCDSIVNLALIVLDPISRNINATICQGKSFIVGDSSYSSNGTYTTILKSIQNCDSTVILNLKIAPQSQTNLNPTICKGSVFQVGTKSYNKSGTYIDTLQNRFLCDSIITTILTVKDPTSQQISITICPGQTITIGQNTYGQQGVYRDTLKSIYGCDSIILLSLSVQSTITFSQTINICEGQNYAIGQNIYSVSGTYKDTLESIGGCDSVVTTKLTVRPIYQKTQNASICPGDSIVFGNRIIKTQGIFTNKFSSIYGCDSTVTLNVIVLRSENEVSNINSCIGKTIKINGLNYSKDTTFSIKYKNQVSCDSIIEYRLKFYPTYQKTVQQSICIGQKFQNITINQDTIIHLKLSSISGCDSIVDVEISAIQKFITKMKTQICSGSTYNGFIITKDTILTKTLASSQGCDSTVIDTIKVLPGLQMTTSMDTVINPGSAVTLFASGANKYAWSTGSTSASIVVRPTTNTIYTVTGTAGNGCTQQVDIAVNVNACVVTAPTYFTPNGDGSHDKWKLKGTECLTEFTLQIINRLGEVIYESTDNTEFWNGNYKDKPAPEGVYFYILDGISPQNKDVVHQNGYIHLNR